MVSKMTYSQRIRKKNIASIQEWIAEIIKEKRYQANQFPLEDENEVRRKAMLMLGCTKLKAQEYLDLIFGR